MLLMGADITFPPTVELLEDPNVWIVGTGASCDSTGSHIGMINRRVPNENDGVTLADGAVKGINMISSIPGH
eukprot:13311262-Ditylum_brightwellii.AAC.1